MGWQLPIPAATGGPQPRSSVAEQSASRQLAEFDVSASSGGVWRGLARARPNASVDPKEKAAEEGDSPLTGCHATALRPQWHQENEGRLGESPARQVGSRNL